MTVRRALSTTVTAALVFAAVGTLIAKGLHLIKQIPVAGDYG